MIAREILRKVRRLEISTRHLVNDVFSGQYQSVFKGRGMEFSEVREYQPGDDIRTIDWNVTARTGDLFVKRYVEERDLTVMLLVDMSGSQDFGTQAARKGEVAAELCALGDLASHTPIDVNRALAAAALALALGVPPGAVRDGLRGA